MGYTTDFIGKFKFNKPLDADTLKLLTGLATTRRMKRNIKGYGIEGEFYIDGGGDFGQADDDTVLDHNRPPKTQPGLWCQWIPTQDGMYLEWDGGEKFYNYVEWLEYLIDKVLKPKGYSISGVVAWRGEDSGDIGTIEVKANKIKVLADKVDMRKVTKD